MPANKKLLILPGDYVGPEIMDQVKRVIRWMESRRAELKEQTFDKKVAAETLKIYLGAA